MTRPSEVIAAAGDHLRRHPAHRYPLEHAAGQFHLGVALTDVGRLDEARAALEVAASLFADHRKPVEEAKARNLLGAALRLLGHPRDAADAFRAAATEFARAGLAAEHGAALYNVGLVERERGDLGAARDAFSCARGLLDGEAPPGQLAAAARELGATLLMLDEPDEACAALEQAVDLGRRAADRAGVGAASNVLGLAHIAAGRPADAVEALKTAVGHHHRSLHAEAHAMALANLALAYEARGDDLRARTAARHAAAVPGAAPPVREQAGAILDRLPPSPADAVALLLDEPRERWTALMRAELDWWIDAPPEARRTAAAGWVEAQAGAEDADAELAHALLGAALELSPERTERVLAALVEGAAAVDPKVAARFRAQVARALPRFFRPQWQRLEESLDRLAHDAGQPPWSAS